jgi:hypothetical protein
MCIPVRSSPVGSAFQHALRASALAAALACAGPATAASTHDRYSLQGGCYAIQDGSGKPIAGADHIRMQATTLGRYLLYRQDRTFLASEDGSTIAPAEAPSPAADWIVDDAQGGDLTIAPLAAQDKKRTVRFTPAAGCATFPEAELNASGEPARGDTEYGRVGGLVEGHMHWMTYEYLGGNFHCGKPWDAYGIQYALPDCSEVEGPQGTAAPVQNFLNFGSPVYPHDTSGYPKMTAWGAGNLTYEGTYWRWIERAWLSGLRLMVMGVNENRVLCELLPTRKTNCDEMDTVRRGFQDIKELQRYVDAQAGGPGKGFFQIVTDPFEARRVINQGRMAVVLEIEVSEPFGCRGWDQPTCDQAKVDKQLEEMYRLGVRSSLLLNKFDNPLTGVRFDSGPVGVLINGGNHQSAGTFFSARTCTGPLHDNEIFTGFQPGNTVIDSLLSTLGVPSGTVPAYPPPPHCNTRGLTTLGKHVVRRMMELGMIVNPDHMSQAGVDDTLTILESRRYSGVISPHGWMDPGNWPRIWKLGGMAFPGHSTASDYVKEWKKYRPESTPFAFGWGYGADLGGLSHQPDVNPDGKISYPFKSYDGRVTFEKQRTGERTFDYTKEGVAHYGLYADWFEDLRRIGGEQLAHDLWDGAEAYIEMWERANGIPATSCGERHATLRRRGLGSIRLGDDWQQLLRRRGQPQQRSRAWSWCVAGRGGRQGADVAVLSDDGEVELAGSSATGRRAGGVAVGDQVPRAGKRVRTSGNFVYAVRRGRVTAVAVATRALIDRPRALRAAMKRVRGAEAAQARPGFVPSPAQAKAAAAGGGLEGQILAGTGNAKLNSAFAYLCSLQVPVSR